MNISEQLVRFLEATPATHVYGVTGDALNHFVRGVTGSDRLRWVGMRHQGNAAFAACAQAQLQGLGVCAGTVGPGALHLINGLYNAKRERLPVVAVTGQIEQHLRGRSYFQEADLGAAFRDVCAYQAVIRSPDQAHHLLRRALQIAVDQRAVCRIELPRNLADAAATSVDAVGLPRRSADLVPDPEAVVAAAERIAAADRITILAGAGGRASCDPQADRAGENEFHFQQGLAKASHRRKPVDVRAIRGASAQVEEHHVGVVVGLQVDPPGGLRARRVAGDEPPPVELDGALGDVDPRAAAGRRLVGELLALAHQRCVDVGVLVHGDGVGRRVARGEQGELALAETTSSLMTRRERKPMWSGSR